MAQRFVLRRSVRQVGSVVAAASSSRLSTQRLLHRASNLPVRSKCHRGIGVGEYYNCKRRFVSSTQLLHEEAKEESSSGGGSGGSEKSKHNNDNDDDDNEDECPEWQNPLHHNDPKLQKQFFEDFEPGEEIPMVPLPPFDDGTDKVLAAPHVHEIADEIVNMNMLEISELVSRISDHFGFDDDMAAMDGGDFAGEGGAAGEGSSKEEEVKEEKTVFDLKLTAFDAKSKIKVIKEVRAITGLGLKEAKEMVEGAPKVIKKDIKMDEAEELKKKLEDIGATVEIA